MKVTKLLPALRAPAVMLRKDWKFQPRKEDSNGRLKDTGILPTVEAGGGRTDNSTCSVAISLTITTFLWPTALPAFKVLDWIPNGIILDGL